LKLLPQHVSTSTGHLQVVLHQKQTALYCILFFLCSGYLCLLIKFETNIFFLYQYIICARQRPCHSSSSFMPASYHEAAGLIQDYFTQDSQWLK
jgi:hypothetical protein